MTGVPRHMAEHRLNVREGCPPVRQKKRGKAPERNKAIQEEVEKLVDAEIMKEVHYHSWLSNPIMVKKHDWSWRMCVDFKDLNKACPRDGYPLPEIDWKVESLCGYLFKCFLDAYKGLTKSKWQRRMKKRQHSSRAKGYSEGMFLGYKVNTEGLKVCPDKADAVLSLPSLGCLKDVHKLNGKLASLNRSLSKSAEKSSPARGQLHPHGKVGISLSQRKQTAKKILSVRIGLDEESPDELMAEPEELPKPWTLFTDGSSCIDGSRAGLIWTNLEGVEFTYAMRFRFEATNNEVEYEALIAGLRIAEQMGVKNLQANVDSHLVANQVNGSYVAKESVPRSENKKADALSKIASTSFAHLSKQVLVEELKKKSVHEREVLAIVEEEEKTWMTPIYEYLTKQSSEEVRMDIHCLQVWPTGKIVSDNGKQFRDNPFKDWANKSLGEGIKARLDERSKDWIGELLHVLWAHHTMIKSSNGETPFSLTYGTEAVIPAEIRNDIHPDCGIGPDKE
ncbi:reverse transcriptase domain-containing protein [Tanacetum coccineum]